MWLDFERMSDWRSSLSFLMAAGRGVFRAWQGSLTLALTSSGSSTCSPMRTVPSAAATLFLTPPRRAPLAPLAAASFAQALNHCRGPDRTGRIPGPALAAPSLPRFSMWREQAAGIPGRHIGFRRDDVHRVRVSPLLCFTSFRAWELLQLHPGVMQEILTRKEHRNPCQKNRAPL